MANKPLCLGCGAQLTKKEIQDHGSLKICQACLDEEEDFDFDNI